jgi:hypothetical protein
MKGGGDVRWRWWEGMLLAKATWLSSYFASWHLRDPPQKMCERDGTIQANPLMSDREREREQRSLKCKSGI